VAEGARREATDVYTTDFTELISLSRDERGIMLDYVGREILELLQNSNDAAAELNTKSRVLIELTERGLIVANTGAPFTTGGVKSLRMPNFSPKTGRVQLIGNKVLDFAQC